MYQVKKDNRNIRESVRENEEQANDPVGLEANLKVLEMESSCWRWKRGFVRSWRTRG